MPQGAEYKFRIIACNAGGCGEAAEIPGVVKVQEMLGKERNIYKSFISVFWWHGI